MDRIMSNLNLMGDLTDKPPENLLDSDETDQKMDVEDNSEFFKSLDNSATSFPVIPTVAIKNYANEFKPEEETDGEKESKVNVEDMKEEREESTKNEQTDENVTEHNVVKDDITGEDMKKSVTKKYITDENMNQEVTKEDITEEDNTKEDIIGEKMNQDVTKEDIMEEDNTKEDIIGEKMNQDVTKEDITEEDNTKEDIIGEKMNQDATKEDITEEDNTKEDIIGEKMNQDVTKEDNTKEDIIGENINQNITKEDIMEEDNTKEDIIGEKINQDVTKQDITEEDNTKEDIIGENINQDITKEDIMEEDNTKEDIIGEKINQDVTKQDITEEDNTKEDIIGENINQDITKDDIVEEDNTKEDIIGENMNQDVTKEDIMEEDNTKEDISEDDMVKEEMKEEQIEEEEITTTSKIVENIEISSGVEGDLDTDASEEKKSKSNKTEALTLRRSSRANKGIGKEIFDPSYIPGSHRHSLDPPKRFHSPSTDRSESPVSSTTSSPGRARGRIVVGQSPRRRQPETPNRDENEEKESEDKSDKKGKNSPPKKTKKDESKEGRKSRLKEPKKVMSKNNFSDDDNVPLKQLKESSEDDDSDDSDDSYNNPDRLWCICKKPHNNRFMISCDQCEDWFHGDCVGITLMRGKKMEQNNEEYICPRCVKKKSGRDSPFKESTSPQRRKSKETKDEPPASSKDIKPQKRSAVLDDKSKSSGVSLKGYALQGQIQRSSTKHTDNGEPQKKKLKVFDEAKVKNDARKNIDEPPSGKKADPKQPSKSSRKCIVSTCDNDALHGSVYCSNQCILRHAKESLKAIVKDKEKTETKQKLIRKESGNSSTHQNKSSEYKGRVSVICRKTNKVLSGSSAPHRSELAVFLKTHPSYEVYRSTSSANNQEKLHVKPQTSSEGLKTTSTIDFFHHVDHQNRKRDRYGVDPEYTPPVKKLSDPSLTSQKHRTASSVVKINSQSTSGHNKSGQSQGNIYKTIQSGGGTSKSHKHRKESTESQRKYEASKLSERRDSKNKEHKRKYSADGILVRKNSEERPSKKIERSNSGGSRSEVKTTSTNIRQNIKKSLFDILKNRSENSEDLKMHPESITRLSTKIEESLYKVHGDTNMKYKNKYRSIMFNLKDARNHGLWRKVIIGDVTTSELVQMSAEQMASKKLAEWRQNELTQELDIIQKQEKEKANIRPVAKITHKGEIAIQEDLSDLTENFNSRENSSTPTVAPIRKKRLSLSEEDVAESTNASTADTTLQHHEHLFDLNCKICTGKIKEEDVEHHEPPTESIKKVKRSTSIILSSEAQKAPHNPQAPKTPTSQIVISEKPRSKKKKKSEKIEESNINSHDASLSPASFLAKLSHEKQRKKKPVLPSPPPLSDVIEREPVEPEKEKEKKPEPQAKEPSPEVEGTTPPGPPPEPVKKPAKPSKLIWSGSISMLELSTFKANVYPVNGCCDNLDIDLPIKLALGGRIHPKVVWDYLGKVSTLPTKQLSVVRFHAATDDDRVGYVAMLSYFSSRKRFGVVSNQDRMLVKDMYLIPLLESQPVPEQLTFCSAGIREALPKNRASMLLGIIVRNVAKTNKPIEPEATKAEQPSKVEEMKEEENEEEEEEEYVPDEAPLLPAEKEEAPLLTDEELGSKSTTKPPGGSLFERNKSLAPSLRFFMRKQSEEEQSRKEQEENVKINEDDQPYSPSEQLKGDDDGGDYDPEDAIHDEGEDEAYDPEKMFQEEDEEEYDPETAFAPISPKNDDEIPYDPEDEEELLIESGSQEVDELVEKQAFLEKMKKELEEKKAKLAQVEESLQKQAMSNAEPAPVRVDPRLARRAALAEEKQATESPKSVTPPPTEPPKPAELPMPPKPADPPKPQEPPKPVDPLQTILSVLNMAQPQSSSAPSGILPMFQKAPSSPPQLPDSTTKSDVDETNEEANDEDKQSKSGLVAYADSPNSSHGDDDVEKKKTKKKDERRRRSSSESSTSSREGSSRRHRHDYDDKRHRRRNRRSRSRSPHRRGRHSPRHRRYDDDYRRHQRRSWSRDRRR